jgi:hypothetical protein
MPSGLTPRMGDERRPGSSLRNEVEVEDGEVREVTREAKENAKAVLKVSWGFYPHIYVPPWSWRIETLPMPLSMWLAIPEAPWLFVLLCFADANLSLIAPRRPARTIARNAPSQLPPHADRIAHNVPLILLILCPHAIPLSCQTASFTLISRRSGTGSINGRRHQATQERFGLGQADLA